MVIINSEKNALTTISEMILTAARTAPKTKGIDSLITGIVEKNEIDPLVDEMLKIYSSRGWEFFKRDATNLRNADSCLLFATTNDSMSLDCGACGMTCTALESKKNTMTEDFNGPICMFKTMDLGIALGSACATAADFKVDNRLMYTIGLAAKRLGLIEGDIVIALPLSVKGKNIFVDRVKKCK